ncbi:tetratricopeptide repeat protein [Roseateles sp. SL47]|uniref:tetratricopeptide repeat protein n=1 Tax=Roseateles sp. SL47 TaxID=2995138 RepID=UPI00226E3BFC|nr:tetratricopeptide repeat protein [Roseateles sp. SL47]WAC75426.1 tetratricopeptide repeat protein [Roseateles sp. SL47]
MVATCVLPGCAVNPVQQLSPPAALVHDDLFPPNQEDLTPDRILAPSPGMRAFIQARLTHGLRGREPRDVLVDALAAPGELKLEYDAEMTRTASEAFDARMGNCLSLTLMTASFARELGVPVIFRQIYQEEQYSRVGDLQVVSGHVNIGLGRRPTDFKVLGDQDALLVVDFLPGAQIRRQRAMELDESTVLAMYMNNRAAEWMALGILDRAYWWARAAWLQSPRLTASLNTLGVIYRRHGDLQPAEQAFREVLRREPGNTQAMGNLAQLLRNTDRVAEASVWEEKLARLEPYPPFKLFDLGLAAMRSGNYAEARRFFLKEIDRSSYYHEFYFWLALANVGLGRWNEVRQSLARAEELSTTVRQRQLYTAKLESLKSRMH